MESSLEKKLRFRSEIRQPDYWAIDGSLRTSGAFFQVAELRARVVMVRRANITRMGLMYGPELSCLSELVRE